MSQDHGKKMPRDSDGILLKDGLQITAPLGARSISSTWVP